MVECPFCADRIAFILSENGHLADACQQKQAKINRLEGELFATANDLKFVIEGAEVLMLDALDRDPADPNALEMQHRLAVLIDGTEEAK